MMDWERLEVLVAQLFSFCYDFFQIIFAKRQVNFTFIDVQTLQILYEFVGGVKVFKTYVEDRVF